MMEELVRFIAKNLVDEPDSVKVESREEGDTVVISLSVAPMVPWSMPPCGVERDGG